MSVTLQKVFVDSLNQVDFDRSLPARYRAAFLEEERRSHAEICARRQTGGVSVGLVPSGKAGQTAFCVNAEDHVGVLAMTSAAFTTLGLEIQEAVAFPRNPPIGPAEVVDVFWLKDPPKIICQADVEAFENLLSEYLTEGSPGPASVPGTRSSSPSGATVRFRDERGGTLSVLEVETGDRFGLLWEVSSALTAAGVQIVASEIRTRRTRVTDAFTIEELSGAAISSDRRSEIQTVVLSALEA